MEEIVEDIKKKYSQRHADEFKNLVTHCFTLPSRAVTPSA